MMLVKKFGIDESNSIYNDFGHSTIPIPHIFKNISDSVQMVTCPGYSTGVNQVADSSRLAAPQKMEV
jgi:hypothetical protein